MFFLCQSHKHTVTHLSLRCGHSSPAWVDLFIDAGQEVLGYSQSILKQREVRMILRSVFQQVLKKRKQTNNISEIYSMFIL